MSSPSITLLLPSTIMGKTKKNTTNAATPSIPNSAQTAPSANPVTKWGHPCNGNCKRKHWWSHGSRLTHYHEDHSPINSCQCVTHHTCHHRVSQESNAIVLRISSLPRMMVVEKGVTGLQKNITVKDDGLCEWSFGLSSWTPHTLTNPWTDLTVTKKVQATVGFHPHLFLSYSYWSCDYRWAPVSSCVNRQWRALTWGSAAEMDVWYQLPRWVSSLCISAVCKDGNLMRISLGNTHVLSFIPLPTHSW